MKLNNELRQVIDVYKNSGTRFAFIVCLGEDHEVWFTVNFHYTSFKPVKKGFYLVEEQKVSNGKIELISEKEINDIEDLISYLIDKEVDPNIYRATH